MKKKINRLFVTAVLAALVIGGNTAYADETAEVAGQAEENVQEQVAEQAADTKSDEAPVRVDSVKKGDDGSVTVVLDPADDVSEIKILPGDHDSNSYDGANSIDGNTINGLEPGDYTLFMKDKDGNVTTAQLNAGKSSTQSSYSESTSSHWEETSSYAYGSSWLEYSVESRECDDCGPTETPAPDPETTPARPSHSSGKTYHDDPEPETSPAIETTPTPQPETTPAVEKLPQTGGLDGRMIGTIGIAAMFIVGWIMFFASSGLDRKK